MPSSSELPLSDSSVEVSDAPSVPVGVPVSSAVDSEGVVEEDTIELAAAVSVGTVLATSDMAVLALTPPVGATTELLAVMVAPLMTVV